MLKQFGLLVASVVFLGGCHLFQGAKSTELVVGFYNVENLFDTINDPAIQDEEFLPSAKKEHNTAKYNEKLEHLATVIIRFQPDVLGLAEIENEGVLVDLVATIKLGKGKSYKIAHTDSKDRRGIDVAYLYNPAVFKLKETNSHSVTIDSIPGFRTRDIYQLQGKVGDETLYFFVNHWPSRWGGQEESEHKRIAAAQRLSTAIKTIAEEQPNAKIIALGDFNDGPTNVSMVDVLQADTVLNADQLLYNTSYHLHKKKLGTHNYRGDWNALDQIIVSKSLMKDTGKGLVLKTPFEAQVLKEDFMLYKSKSGAMLPSRSYGGNKYYGGYSDHLPTFIVLTR